MEVAPVFPNNPVVGFDPNNPVPVLLANKLPEVLENNPLPFVVALTVVALLVNNPENNPPVVGLLSTLVYSVLFPLSVYFFTVTILHINNIKLLSWGLLFCLLCALDIGLMLKCLLIDVLWC